MSCFKIDMEGFLHGDPIIWNEKTQIFGQIKIPFTNHDNKNLPNFIIALSGQSNSQGLNTKYDPNNIDDQPDTRIFGWNPNKCIWEIANLLTESLGYSYVTFKQSGTQCLAFHFAKHLVKAYPNIRPGIINIGVSGASICLWTKYKSDSKWYNLTMEKLKYYEGKNTFPDFKTKIQGYLFNLHTSHIDMALNFLDEPYRKVNVICWHQGESDANTAKNYLFDSLKLVIEQYKNFLIDKKFYDENFFGFILGTTTGKFFIEDNIKKNVNNQLELFNKFSEKYIKCVDLTDLTVTTDNKKIQDIYHLSSESQRIAGLRYLKAYRSIFSNQ